MYLKGDLRGRVYYCQPDQILEADLGMEKEINKVTKADRFIIPGDFNYPHIDWVIRCLRNWLPRHHN